MRFYFSLLLLLISLNCYSQEFYSYFDIGNIGVEFNTDDLQTLDYTYITFPTFYIRERGYDIGLSIQSSELRVPFFTTESFYFTFLETSLFWSPLEINDLAILGTFVDINLIPNRSYWLSARIGLKFMWVSSSIDLFKNSRLPKEMVMRNLDFEIGYSFLDDYFYASLSTDFSIIFEGLNYIDSSVINKFFY